MSNAKATTPHIHSDPDVTRKPEAVFAEMGMTPGAGRRPLLQANRSP